MLYDCSKGSAASLYLDAKGEDYDGLSLIAASVAKDISLVTKEKAKANVVTKTESLKEYAIIAGSIGNNAVIDSLIEQGKVDASQIKGKREVYRIPGGRKSGGKCKKSNCRYRK